MAKRGAPPGNKNGAKGKIWSDAVRKALIQGKSLDPIARKLIAMALEGDMAAIREIGDRMDGKAHQSVSVETSPIEEMDEQQLIAEALRLQSAGIIEALGARRAETGDDSGKELDSDVSSVH